MKIIRITFYVLHLLLVLRTSQSFASAGVDSTSNAYSDTTLIRSDSTLVAEPSDSTSIEVPVKQLPQIGSSDSTAILREHKRAFLEGLFSERSSAYNRTDAETTSYTPYTIGYDKIYRSDKTSPSELLKESPFFISIPFGLSSSLSRTLHYGSTAPLTFINSSTLLNVYHANPISGTDQKFLTETATFHLYPGSLIYKNPSYALAAPEVLIFWENGVFDENIVSVRFSRPFARTLSAHVFSNYRYFEGMSFNHRGNDVYSTFSRFQDSSVVSNEGYNPLVDERHSGAGLRWSDRGHTLNLSINYGEFNNEVALDIPGDVDKAVHAKYFRYPLSIQSGLTLKLPDSWFAEFETQIHNEPIVRITGEAIENSTTLKRVRKDALERQFFGGVKGGLQLFSHDSTGILYTINTHKRKVFNDSEAVVVQHHPALFYQKQITKDRITATFQLKSGITVSAFEDSTTVTPQWLASGDMRFGNKSFRLYAQRDIVPFVSEHDSLTRETFAIDNYFRTGCELFLDLSILNLCVGYHYTSGIDKRTVENAWPSGTPPYRQPQSALLLAPAFNIGENLRLKTRMLISDEKPYIKVSGAVSYSIHPIQPEYFDFTLYTEYWSERDPVIFAGKDDWNEQIVNVGLEIAAQIKSFRLFYKIDNVLNRQFAYVPGYYSPGITFRWGFNWFIQR